MEDLEIDKKRLLQAYVSGKCSREDLRLMGRMLENGQLSHEDIDSEALRRLGSIQEDEDQLRLDAKWQSFSETLKNGSEFKRNKKPVLRMWVGISSAAAAILLLVVLGTGLFNFYKNQSEIDTLLSMEELPNGLSTTLVTSEGTLIRSDLVQSTLEVLSRQRGMLFDGNKTLIPSAVEEKSALNRLLVPFGKTASVVLSDGTRVWLNAGSRLVFPNSFESASNREVFLTGEGYFDVTSDKSKPFVVMTRKMSYKVLGTTFNINTSDDSSGDVSVLESGSLLVEQRSLLLGGKVLLVPGQKSEFGLGDKNIRVSEVNTAEYTSWKDGYLLFNNHSIRAITQKLSRYYNLHFIVSDQLAQTTLVSGKLLLLPDYETAIQVLCDLSGLKYKISGTTIELL